MVISIYQLLISNRKNLHLDLIYSLQKYNKVKQMSKCEMKIMEKLNFNQESICEVRKRNNFN